MMWCVDMMVEFGDGESFVIGGLIDCEIMFNINKVLFLGDLFIIGVFFKNLSYQQNDKEFVIIVMLYFVVLIVQGVLLLVMLGELFEQCDGLVWCLYLGGMVLLDVGLGFLK